MDITIRNIDANLYKLAKITAVEDSLTIGEVVNRALRQYLCANKKKQNSIYEIKAVDLGDRRLSERIDEIIYKK